MMVVRERAAYTHLTNKLPYSDSFTKVVQKTTTNTTVAMVNSLQDSTVAPPHVLVALEHGTFLEP